VRRRFDRCPEHLSLTVLWGVARIAATVGLRLLRVPTQVRLLLGVLRIRLATSRPLRGVE
jgi:hypothetical protein